jgi:hypothetical protein
MTTRPGDDSGSPVHQLLRGLLDDAALFPPGNSPMPKAVAAHARLTNAWYGEFTGPFVCPETRLSELRIALTTTSVGWIGLALVVTAGAAAVAAATDAVATDPRLRLRAIEVPADKDAEPGQAIADVAAALDAAPLAAVTGYIEVPLTAIAAPGAGYLLTMIDERGYRPKLRTGGMTRQAFPDEAVLAACLAELTGRRIPFKCTAGLHHAVRHADATTGFEHHGFLNVLLATGIGLRGGDAGEIAGVLAERDPAAVAGAVLALGTDAAAEIRDLFTSFGTCSIDDPVADLISLGLLSKPGELFPLTRSRLLLWAGACPDGPDDGGGDRNGAAHAERPPQHLAVATRSGDGDQEIAPGRVGLDRPLWPVIHVAGEELGSQCDQRLDDPACRGIDQHEGGLDRPLDHADAGPRGQVSGPGHPPPQRDAPDVLLQ